MEITAVISSSAVSEFFINSVYHPQESLLSEPLPLVFNIPRDALEKVNTAPPPATIDINLVFVPSPSVVKSGRVIGLEEDD